MIHKKYPEIAPESFKFELVSDSKKETENLDTEKSSTYGSITAAILKQCVNTYLPYLTILIILFRVVPSLKSF